MKKYLGLYLLAILLLFIGVITQDPYILHILIILWLNIILATSLWLIYSTGEMSLAHVSMMAIGAYSSALLVMRIAVSFWFALPISGLIAALFSFLIGFPASRLKGFAFFMVTFAFAEIVMTIVSNFWQDAFGGHSGIFAILPPSPISFAGFTLSFSSKVAQYYLGLIIMALIVFFIHFMVKSRFGRISKAIAQADILAESIGIDVSMHKIIAFTIGGFFAGIAGSLSAHMFRVIAPLDFGINYMIMVIAFVVVGGAANIFGPIIGACFFSLLSLLLAEWGHVEVLITGLILILVMRFLPGGLLSFPSTLRRLKSRE